LRPVTFEWDENKARMNLRKHGVSFAAAQEVFDDPLAGIRDDSDHSLGEEREIIVGQTRLGRLLLVSFTGTDKVIRIISARELTHKERRSYEKKSHS
jgi:uncharacterized DUF497 family protein